MGEVYNIGGGEEIANIDLVKQILDILDMPYTLITYVNDRLGHDLRYAVDCSKLESLAWKREYTMKDTFTGIVEWYRDALKS